MEVFHFSVPSTMLLISSSTHVPPEVLCSSRSVVHTHNFSFPPILSPNSFRPASSPLSGSRPTSLPLPSNPSSCSIVYAMFSPTMKSRDLFGGPQQMCSTQPLTSPSTPAYRDLYDGRDLILDYLSTSDSQPLYFYNGKGSEYSKR